MCVVSNIGDHYGRPYEWPWHPVKPTVPEGVPDDFSKIWREAVEAKELADLRDRIKALEELIRKGKEYDQKTGQSNCELDEKKQKVIDLARSLGFEISFK